MNKKLETIFVSGFLMFVFIFIVCFVYSIKNTDEEISDFKKMNELVKKFESELNKIELPEKTARAEVEKSNKLYESVSVRARYHSEADKSVVMKKFLQELKLSGWILYKTDSQRGFTDFTHCRQKYTATFTVEHNSVWNTYKYHLNYTLSGRPILAFGDNKLPNECY